MVWSDDASRIWNARPVEAEPHRLHLIEVLFCHHRFLVQRRSMVFAVVVNLMEKIVKNLKLKKFEVEEF